MEQKICRNYTDFGVSQTPRYYLSGKVELGEEEGPVLLSILSALALYYEEIDEVSIAGELYEKIYEDRLRLQGEDNGNLTETLFDLGIFFYRKKEYSRAVVYLDKYCEKTTAIGDATDLGALRVTYETIAECYAAMGDKENENVYLNKAKECERQMWSTFSTMLADYGDELRAKGKK